MKISVFFVYVLRTASELNISIKDALKKMKEIGYDMVEFDITELKIYPNALSESREVGLLVSNVYGECESESEVYELLDKAKECLSPCAMVLPKQKFHANTFDELEGSKYVQDFVNVLKKGVVYAQKLGINLTLECYGNENIASKMNSLSYLFDKVDGLKHTYDSGNFYLNGEDGLVALEKFKDITVHVHLKDYLSKSPINSDFSASQIASAVGYGAGKIKEILVKLNEIGYSGAFTVEYLGVENTYSVVKKSIEWLKG